MKKALLGLILLGFALSARAQLASDRDIFTINLGVTNMTASSTNITTVMTSLPRNGSASSLFIMGRGEGIAATTNGVSSVSNLVFRIQLSHDGTNYTDASVASTLSVKPLGYTTNYNGAFLTIPGIVGLKVITENNTLGTQSNIYLQGSFNH